MPDFELNNGIDLEPDLNDAFIHTLGSFGKTLTFGRNEHLYYQGDPADHLYVLKSGVVKATHGDTNGYEWLLRFHGSGSLMGIEALRPLMVRDASSVALEDVEAICLGREEFLNHVRSNSELGVLLAQALARRISLLHTRVEGVVGHSVEQRVARALLQLYVELAKRTPVGVEPVLKVTHEELATLVLSRRQYVTAILRGFVAAGLIENKRRRIRISNLERLSEVYNG